MTSPIDRAAEAPRILGVEMTPYLSGWTIGFGSISVELVPSGRVSRFGDDWIGYVCGYLHGNGLLPDCVSAIERELQSIRSAIPAPESKP